MQQPRAADAKAHARHGSRPGRRGLTQQVGRGHELTTQNLHASKHVCYNTGVDTMPAKGEAW
jgi:hypothetical protein